MNQKDKTTLKALRYLVRHKYGKVTDLKISDKLIREFCTLGFIRTGWTNDTQTWRILPFGESYYNSVKGSFFSNIKKLFNHSR